MQESGAREPIFRAPWPSLLLVLSIPALYALQSTVQAEAQVELLRRFALIPASLAEQGYAPLLTMLLLHGSWAHALVNAASALAFAPPVARLFGARARGVIGFLVFYILCGVISGLGYALLNPGSDTPVVGASGAISGLFAAASRLLGSQSRLQPLFSSRVLIWAAVFALMNVMLGLSNLTPGAEGMPVAWQAHLAGYLAGLILVGPIASLIRGPSAASFHGEPQLGAAPMEPVEGAGPWGEPPA